ncbi:hypothetical protein MMC22_006065 [Lobaria immixta]|nr:hypothetical protein [Lobaria immixta]
MIFFSSFRRKSLFAAHALGPSWLTIFLLSSRLCFLASSYTIDASCRNYKGHDISGDMQQAINEVHEMAINAMVRISHGDPSTIHLLESLFGRDPARYTTVSGYLTLFAFTFPTSDFVVICNDLMVKIEPDPSTNRKPDPRGRWVDPVHGWHLPYDEHDTCDPLHKPGSGAGHGMTTAYTIHGTDGNEELREYPPVHLASDPASLNTRSIVEAYGFTNCFRLAYESPDLALENPDNTALCALGKPDSKLAKHHQKEEDLLIRLESRSLLA